MVSNMSSTNACSSGVSNFVIGAAGRSRIGLLRYRTTLYTISEIPYLFDVSVEVASGLAERIAAEFFEECLAEHDGDHRFSDDTGGRDDTNIRTLIRGFG